MNRFLRVPFIHLPVGESRFASATRSVSGGNRVRRHSSNEGPVSAHTGCYAPPSPYGICSRPANDQELIISSTAAAPQVTSIPRALFGKSPRPLHRTASNLGERYPNSCARVPMVLWISLKQKPSVLAEI